MTDFDITEESKTKDFIRFIAALGVGVMTACVLVFVLGVFSL